MNDSTLLIGTTGIPTLTGVIAEIVPVNCIGNVRFVFHQPAAFGCGVALSIWKMRVGGERSSVSNAKECGVSDPFVSFAQNSSKLVPSLTNGTSKIEVVGAPATTTVLRPAPMPAVSAPLTT